MNPYSLKYSQKARRMRLAVYCDGSVVVTVPRRFDHGLVERFVAEKSEWIRKKIEYFKNIPRSKIIHTPLEIKILKREARELAYKRLMHFNQLYNFRYRKIAIKNQKTRWGSCSKKGNLNFNYKIALLTPEQADYIIVHELCHLGEFNHSRRFWFLVAKTIPDYKMIRKELRYHDLTLRES